MDMFFVWHMWSTRRQVRVGYMGRAKQAEAVQQEEQLQALREEQRLVQAA